jgi:hypothetical protein
MFKYIQHAEYARFEMGDSGTEAVCLLVEPPRASPQLCAAARAARRTLANLKMREASFEMMLAAQMFLCT